MHRVCGRSNVKEQAKGSSLKEKKESISLKDARQETPIQEKQLEEEEDEINLEEIKRTVFEPETVKPKSLVNVVGKIDLDQLNSKKNLSLHSQNRLLKHLIQLNRRLKKSHLPPL